MTYVIMGSTGEYSDRCVFTLGHTIYEHRAKELVLEFAEKDRLEHSIKNAKDDLRFKFYESWQAENPYPVEEDNPKPVFDQSRHKDKEYVKEHTQRKAAWINASKAFSDGPCRDWYNAQNEAANRYVEAAFTMDLCEPPKWTDTQYWYEEVEELE